MYMVQRGMLEEERRDRLYFRGMYPQTLGLVQDRIEEECDKLEYEGSIMFDEYPDKNGLRRLLGRIMENMEPEKEISEDIVEILMLQEIIRRRMRWRRYKKQFNN